MSRLAKADVLSLSVSERIKLVEEIWDSLAEIPEQVCLSEEQRNELDRRLAAYHRDPSEGAPWGVVMDRIRSRK